jgi:hypothetical protein
MSTVTVTLSAAQQRFANQFRSALPASTVTYVLSGPNWVKMADVIAVHIKASVLAVQNLNLGLLISKVLNSPNVGVLQTVTHALLIAEVSRKSDRTMQPIDVLTYDPPNFVAALQKVLPPDMFSWNTVTS